MKDLLVKIVSDVKDLVLSILRIVLIPVDKACDLVIALCNKVKALIAKV